MSGLRNETDILTGCSSLSPQNSKYNFACPREDILRNINPLGENFPSVFEPGLIEAMIDLKSQRNTDETSYVLIFDGKKVREGGDVDVLGFENGPTISERESLIETERKIISDIIHLLTIVSRSCSTVSKTNPNYRSKILDKLATY